MTKKIHFVIKYRIKQLEEKQEAAKKYGNSNRDVTGWLTDTERRLAQMHPAGRDLKTVQAQLKEVKVQDYL